MVALLNKLLEWYILAMSVVLGVEIALYIVLIRPFAGV